MRPTRAARAWAGFAAAVAALSGMVIAIGGGIGAGICVGMNAAFADTPPAPAAGDSAECPDSNMQYQFSKIPTRDQGSQGICYAESTAQLVDYYRVKNNPQLFQNGMSADQMTSAVALAVHAKNAQNQAQAGSDPSKVRQWGNLSLSLDGAKVPDTMKSLSDPSTPASLCSQGGFKNSLGILSSLLTNDPHSDSDSAMVSPSEAYDESNPRRMDGSGKLQARAKEVQITASNPELFGGIDDLLGYTNDARCPGPDAQPGSDPLDKAIARLKTVCNMPDSSTQQIHDQIFNTMNALFPCTDVNGEKLDGKGQKILPAFDQTLANGCSGSNVLKEMCPASATCAPPFTVQSMDNSYHFDTVKGHINFSLNPDKQKAMVSSLNSAIGSGNPVVVAVCPMLFYPPKDGHGNPDGCRANGEKAANAAYAAGVTDGSAIAGAFSNGYNPRPPSKPVPGVGTTHAVVVIGSRKTGGKCQYLLRNSWGPHCAGYANCDGNGNQWVDASDFKKALMGISYMQPSAGGPAAPALAGGGGSSDTPISSSAPIPPPPAPPQIPDMQLK